MLLKSKTTRIEVTRSLFDAVETDKKTHDITYRYDLDAAGAISNLNGDCRKADTGQTVINMTTANGGGLPRLILRNSWRQQLGHHGSNEGRHGSTL